jgi:ubiquinone/menaquinone biosynthesis C-methylase UbiE
MSDATIKEAVREKYSQIAIEASSCCGPTCGCGTESGVAGQIIMNDLYDRADPAIRQSADLGLGCGTPAEFADLHPGATVLDLGSGAGIDVFLAAKEVGPTGRVIGVDMTKEMVTRARGNKIKLGADNTEFRLGEIEDLPVDSGTVDRIISNCVINLVPDKRAAFREMYRVLRPGGKFAVSDIVSVGPIPPSLRADMAEWAGCVAGAVERDEYLAIARSAGFRDVTIARERAYQLPEDSTFGLLSITVTGTK